MHVKEKNFEAVLTAVGGEAIADVRCGGCGRSLGRYEAFRDDLGVVFADPWRLGVRDTEGNPRFRRQRPQTGARAFETVEWVDRSSRQVRRAYKWRCGYGATPKHRTDRMGLLPVAELPHAWRPVVYV